MTMDSAGSSVSRTSARREPSPPNFFTDANSRRPVSVCSKRSSHPPWRTLMSPVAELAGRSRSPSVSGRMDETVFSHGCLPSVRTETESRPM